MIVAGLGRRPHAKPEGQRTALALMTTTFVHGLVLWSLLTLRPVAPPVSQPPDLTVGLFAASVLTPSPPTPVRSPPTEPKPPPTPPAKADPAPDTPASIPALDPTAEPTPLDAPTPTQARPVAQEQAQAQASNPCDLTGPVQVALQNDASARASLLRIPQQARSVANAVKLWDGAWIGTGQLGGETIAAPIRDRIIAVVAALPGSCLHHPLQGPRLVSVSDTAGTTVLAIGSGLWAWSDLAPTQSSSTP